MTPEMKIMHGNRQSDSDDFTYVSGKYKDGRIKRTRNKNQTARCIRNDKRSVKAAETRRVFKEQSE